MIPYCRYREVTKDPDVIVCNSNCLGKSDPNNYLPSYACTMCGWQDKDCSPASPGGPLGPGGHLKKLLSKIGIVATERCNCTSKAAEMDRKGSLWCRKNIDLICEWLQDEARKRKLPFFKPAAKILIKRAIRLSEAELDGRHKCLHPKVDMPDEWACAMTTAPREDSTISLSVCSVRASGFEPVVFSEPGSDLFGIDCHSVERDRKLGCWMNWMESLRETLRLSPNAEKIAIFQDDVVLCRDVRKFLDCWDWSDRKLGCISLYSSAKFSNSIGRVGAVRCPSKYHLGALAYVFPRRVAEKVAATTKWRGHWRDDIVLKGTRAKSVDTFVGHEMARLGLSAYFMIPSLAQHIGDNSTVGNGDPKTSTRRSSTFVGEEFSAMNLT